jgi:hypothetical protein
MSVNIQETSLNLDPKQYYNEQSTVDCFNSLLNGHWHIDLNCNQLGQIEIEELIIKNLAISHNDIIFDYGSGVGNGYLRYPSNDRIQNNRINISEKQVALSRQLQSKLKIKKICRF